MSSSLKTSEFIKYFEDEGYRLFNHTKKEERKLIMLKTIKETKQMRLDELIKYVRENRKTLFKNRVEITFSTKNNNEVTFYQHGELTLDNWVSSVDLFPVEIEEEITEETEFDELYTLMKFKNVYRHDAKTINEVKECFKFSGEFELLHQIYVMVDGKLELIWESEN